MQFLLKKIPLRSQNEYIASVIKDIEVDLNEVSKYLINISEFPLKDLA